MKIAITQRVIDFRNGPYDALDHGYYQMFQDHQLLPIPNSIEHFDANIISEADVIVFSGGNSMFEDSWQYNEERLRVEKHTLDLAKVLDKNILGISRGCQFLTVSLGGSLLESDRHTDDHSVYYKGKRVNVRSRHQEVLNKIPNGCTVLASDEQGNCESWKLHNMVTVLWHPERMKTHWMPEEAWDLFR